MAVFSNDPTIQRAWQNAESARKLASGPPCPPTADRGIDLCRGDDEKRRRLGSKCIQWDKVPNVCPDYAAQSRAADKALKDAQQAVADQNRKNKLKEAEERLNQRKQDLITAAQKACAVKLGPAGGSGQLACMQQTWTKDRRLLDNPTFDEVEREAGVGSNTSGGSGPTKKPAKLKAKAKAKAKAAARLRNRNR